MPRYPKNLAKQFKICVTGAAGGPCMAMSKMKARAVGREIAKAGAVLVTGATTGIPNEAARGAKEAGGMSIGFSPAASPKEHVKKFRLPVKYFDLIVYTGFNYAGRNLLLTRASDAVIVVCGRIGTLNEFTIAFEDRKLIGVLRESGGTADEIPHILENAKRALKSTLVSHHDPKTLVQKVVAALKKERGNGSLYYV